MSLYVITLQNYQFHLHLKYPQNVFHFQRKQLNLPQLQAEARLQKDIQAAKVIIIIVFAFLGCYIPPLCIVVWHRSNSHSTENTWTRHLVHTSILISSGINPVIYCFRTSRFRCALKQLLNDPCGKTAFKEIKQEQRATEIIPNRIARSEKFAREPDQDTFKTALERDQDRFERTSCPSLFQWVSNSNCCTGRMGRVAPRFQQKKTSENNNEESERRADNKATPLTIQESQTQIVIPPTKLMDNENYKEKLSRKERPTFKANDSRQEVTVEVHPKRYHSLPNLRKKQKNLQHQGII